MQKEIIFVATNDPEFEKTALDAIVKTRHGMRKTGDPCDVWRLLMQDGKGVALAVIDVDFDDCGKLLFHTLVNSEPGFPILAVAADPATLFAGKRTSYDSIHCLVKPVDAGLFSLKVAELCDLVGERRADGGTHPEASML